MVRNIHVNGKSITNAVPDSLSYKEHDQVKFWSSSKVIMYLDHTYKTNFGLETYSKNNI